MPLQQILMEEKTSTLYAGNRPQSKPSDTTTSWKQMIVFNLTFKYMFTLFLEGYFLLDSHYRCLRNSSVCNWNLDYCGCCLALANGKDRTFLRHSLAGRQRSWGRPIVDSKSFITQVEAIGTASILICNSIHFRGRSLFKSKQIRSEETWGNPWSQSFLSWREGWRKPVDSRQWCWAGSETWRPPALSALFKNGWFVYLERFATGRLIHL